MQGVAGVQSAHAVRDDVNARLGFWKAKAGYLGGQRLGPHLDGDARLGFWKAKAGYLGGQRLGPHLDGAEHRHLGKAGVWKRRANSAKVVLPETALGDEEAGSEDQVHHHQDTFSGTRRFSAPVQSRRAATAAPGSASRSHILLLITPPSGDVTLLPPALGNS